MKKIFIIVVMVLLLCGCGNNKYENHKAKVVEIKEKSLDDILSENNYIVVDVRTKSEYNEGHVKGSINIEYDSIDENVSLDKTKTILVYCKSGGRSQIAYETLKNLGYNVYNLGAYESIILEKE